VYSSAVASKVADLVTKVLLTETQFREMIEALDEMENLSEEIFEELGE
jgi:hypothetical protein